MNVIVSIIILLSILTIYDLLFIAFFLNIRIDEKLYGIVLLSSMLYIVTLFGMVYLFEQYPPQPVARTRNFLVLMAPGAMIKDFLYRLFISQDKKKVGQMVVFSSIIGLLTFAVAVYLVDSFGY